MECCRICFTPYVTAEVLGETQEKDFLESLFTREGINEQLDGYFLICYECKAYLKKTCIFIQKCLKSQRAFLVLQDNKNVNTHTWITFRNQLGLNSSLGYHKAEINLILKDEENLLHEDEIDSNKLFNDCELVSIKVENSVENNVLGNDNNYDDGIEHLHTIDINSEGHDLKPVQEIKSEKITSKHNINEKKRLRKNNDDADYNPKQAKKKKNKKKNDNQDSGVKRRKQKDCKKQKTSVDTTAGKEDGNKEKQKVNFTDLYPDNILTEKRRSVKENKYLESDVEEDPETENKIVVKKKKNKEEADFTINSELSSSESESSYDSYDDNGKKLKRPPREYPRQCDHCDMEIQEKILHYRHYLVHHTHDMYPYQTKVRKQFICQHCGSRKRNQWDLAQHEAIHGEKNVLCPDCGKSFYTKKSLHKHIYIVHSEPKFVCNYCNKGFQSRMDLTRHIRTHTGEKPYKCNICGTSYAVLGNLTIHLRKGHSRLDDKGNLVAKKNRSRKTIFLKKSKSQESDDDYDVSVKTRKKKTKKTKNRAKHDKDATSNNFKVQETNDFDKDIPLKIIEKKGLKKAKKTKKPAKYSEDATSNISKVQETDDDDDDDIPLLTLKTENSTKTKNRAKYNEKTSHESNYQPSPNNPSCDQPEECNVQAENGENIVKGSIEVEASSVMIPDLEDLENIEGQTNFVI